MLLSTLTALFTRKHLRRRKAQTPPVTPPTQEQGVPPLDTYDYKTELLRTYSTASITAVVPFVVAVRVEERHESRLAGIVDHYYNIQAVTDVAQDEAVRSDATLEWITRDMSLPSATLTVSRAEGDRIIAQESFLAPSPNEAITQAWLWACNARVEAGSNHGRTCTTLASTPTMFAVLTELANTILLAGTTVNKEHEWQCVTVTHTPL